MADPLPPIPRSRGEDDWSRPAVEARLDVWEKAAGVRPPHVGGERVALESSRGKIENLVSGLLLKAYQAENKVGRDYLAR